MAYVQQTAPVPAPLPPVPAVLWADNVKLGTDSDVLVEMTADDFLQTREFVRAAQAEEEAEEPKNLDPATWILIFSGLAQLLLRYFTKSPIVPFWDVFTGR